MSKQLASALTAALALAGCVMENPAAVAARDQQQLAAALGGRVAGAPLRCLPSYQTRDMFTAGGEIMFRDGATIYRARTSGDCRMLGDSGYTLVLNPAIGGSLCGGDLAKVVTSSGGMIAGSCSFEDFTPYRRP